MTRRVHLVGTLGQADVPTGMKLAVERVGPFLETITDGEPGDRAAWITSLVGKLGQHPAMRVIIPSRLHKDPVRPWSGAVYIARRGHQLVPTDLGIRIAQRAAEALPVLQDLNHAAGYAIRLQVDIPGPFDLSAFLFGPLWKKYYGAVTEALSTQVSSIDQLTTTRPVYQLSVPIETYVVARLPAAARRRAAHWLVRKIVNFVCGTSPGTEWIIHFCVGDPHGRSLITLKDVAPLVILTDAIQQHWPTGYRLNAVHWPLGDGMHPVTADPRYFEPARRLNLADDVHLSAGLAHIESDLCTQAQAVRLLEDVAERPVGVSTPCGLGRRPQHAEDLLARMAELAQ